MPRLPTPRLPAPRLPAPRLPSRCLPRLHRLTARRIRTREACRPASTTPPTPSLLACAKRCASTPPRLLEHATLRHLCDRVRLCTYAFSAPQQTAHTHGVPSQPSHCTRWLRAHTARRDCTCAGSDSSSNPCQVHMIEKREAPLDGSGDTNCTSLKMNDQHDAKLGPAMPVCDARRPPHDSLRYEPRLHPPYPQTIQPAI